MGFVEELWAPDASDNTIAPAEMTMAPTTTAALRDQGARRNSRKRTMPQKMPIRLLQFQRGNAILRPTSRTASMLSVFPTAHRQPAITPQTIRCGTFRVSTKTSEVPRIKAGRLHRETNAPSTIMNEMTNGDTEAVTSLLGASAAASQTAAARPQNTPRICSFCWRERGTRTTGLGIADVLSTE